MRTRAQLLPLWIPEPDIAPGPDLRTYHRIVVNSSAGKDSQAALDVTVEQARAAGVLDRLVVAHADLGDNEWPGVPELAAEHAAHYGLRFEIVARRKADGTVDTILDRVAQRGLWPDAKRRWCLVNCTIFPSLIVALLVVIKECGVDLRQQLMEGHAPLPPIGSVVKALRSHPPFVVLDGDDVEVEVVTEFLRDLVLGDASPLTCRSYAYDLLRWFRLLWTLEMGWDRATESEVAVMVGWLRTAVNPQRTRRKASSPAPGTVNLRTGKSMLAAGYARSSINHALSAVSGFYEYHGHYGRGPVVNPVPSSPQRRRALAHRSPLETKPVVGRARLRQKVVDRPPRAIPDRLWDALFEAMGCERDRAALEFFVSSGARAAELLGVTPEDIDWAGRRIFVVSKGTCKREPIPASPQAFVRLARYFDQIGTPKSGESIWRTRRGQDRPLSYWALRRVVQRANSYLGTNWTLHDMRHTAATRMANSDRLTLVEVQTILRHADIQTTGRYLTVGVEELFDKLAEHYARPRVEPSYAPGYDPADIEAVFGA